MITTLQNSYSTLLDWTSSSVGSSDRLQVLKEQYHTWSEANPDFSCGWDLLCILSSGSDHTLGHVCWAQVAAVTLFSLVFLFFLPCSLLVAPSGLVMGEHRAVVTSPLSAPRCGQCPPWLGAHGSLLSHDSCLHPRGLFDSGSLTVGRSLSGQLRSTPLHGVHLTLTKLASMEYPTPALSSHWASMGTSRKAFVWTDFSRDWQPLCPMSLRKTAQCV